ncbi:VWA domain-containing protein [Alteromonas lipolytica]|uniref:VWFA domain-containing protein n=1 Tax=Alteromonas lipolytica TaxID=1856405 RepID=A0A1E8FEJ0_9ALTE|nr:VWA domain-containing protein [Alteromonas lipolytica]OFI34176.1 hypothetical protein BFC17_21810 [Alteromonas lipolytica]GGF84387.1 VWA domain-containing protein [Alteromonas lipolytica]
MSITFLHPYYALLLLLLLLPAILWLGRRSKTSLSVLRCLLITALVLALMQPVWLHSSTSAMRVFIVDTDSANAMEDAGAEQAWLNEQIASLPQTVAVKVIQIGGMPLSLNRGEIKRLPSGVNEGALAKVVQQALLEIPAHANADITLLSDGLSTTNNWAAALAELTSKNVHLNWAELPATATPLLSKLTVLPARIGQALTLQVSAESLSDASQWRVDVVGAEVSVSRYIDPRRAQETLNLGTASVPFSPLAVKLFEIQGDKQIERDSRDIIAVSQPAITLFAANADKTAVSALQTLVGDAITVTSVSQYNSFIQGINASEAIWLNNASEKQLSEFQQQAIRAAVKQGKGLFYSGGEMAFASGGMANSPLAEALPVTLTQTLEKTEPSVALAIVIDSSGSMQGKPLELAKQVARLAVRKLNPDDQVGIVEFYGTRQWSVPMQPVKTPENIERAISRMQSMGATQLFPAIQEAYFGLKQIPARYRHILVITDAGIEEENYQHLLRFVAQDQINVSTVLVGSDTAREAQMADLANWGRGRYYSIADEFAMVELNFHKPAEQPEPVFKQGAFWLQGEKSERIPPLNGYAKINSRANAQTLLSEVNASDVVMASWQYGAGRVTALMTDPIGNGTERWQDWSEYGQWLGTQLSEVADFAPPVVMSSTRLSDHVLVTLRVDQTTDRLKLAQLNAQTGQWQEIAVEQRAPGIYTASIAASLDEAVMLRATVDAKNWYAANSEKEGWFNETRVSLAAKDALNRVVEQSGGKHLTLDTRELPAVKADLALKETLLYPWLLAFALLLYFAEIICRRWPTASINPGAR